VLLNGSLKIVLTSKISQSYSYTDIIVNFGMMCNCSTKQQFSGSRNHSITSHVPSMCMLRRSMHMLHRISLITTGLQYSAKRLVHVIRQFQLKWLPVLRGCGPYGKYGHCILVYYLLCHF